MDVMEFICLCDKQLLCATDPIESRASLSCCSSCGRTLHRSCFLEKLQGGQKCPRCEDPSRKVMELCFNLKSDDEVKSIRTEIPVSLTKKLEELSEHVKEFLRMEKELTEMYDAKYMKPHKKEYYFGDEKLELEKNIPAFAKTICAVVELCLKQVIHLKRKLELQKRRIAAETDPEVELSNTEENVELEEEDKVFDQLDAKEFTCQLCRKRLFLMDVIQCCVDNKLSCHSLCGSVFHYHCTRESHPSWITSESVGKIINCPKCGVKMEEEEILPLLMSIMRMPKFDFKTVSLEKRLALIKKHTQDLEYICFSNPNTDPYFDPEDELRSAMKKPYVGGQQEALEALLKPMIEQGEILERELDKAGCKKRPNKSEDEYENSKKNRAQ